MTRIPFALFAGLSLLSCADGDGGDDTTGEVSTTLSSTTPGSSSGPDPASTSTTGSSGAPMTSSTSASPTSDGSVGGSSTGGNGSTSSGCTPGSEGCSCVAGECLGALVCDTGVCGDSMCPEGLPLMCDGTCVDPMNDNENCGSCGRQCLVAGASGACDGGTCTPTIGNNCISFDDRAMWPTCDSICGGIGASCVERGCAGNTYVVYPSCGTSTSDVPQVFNTDPCDEPIAWGGAAQGAVLRCCCTQP